MNTQRLLTSGDCLLKYGRPETEKFMTLLRLPEDLDLPAVPRRIYCNRDMAEPLLTALKRIDQQGNGAMIVTWDGCFNIRNKRGQRTWSLHAWGLAVDINAAWNRLGKVPTMPHAIVAAFNLAGFDWGGQWNTPDGMHFQLKRQLVIAPPNK